MSIFSFNEEPVVVPVETAEESLEATENHYADVSEEDYTTAEEPEFGDDA
jgi:predicted ribonuclease YlaK